MKLFGGINIDCLLYTSLEATQPDVCKTPLEKFLKQAKSVNGNPVVVVGRLKPKYQKSIPRAIEILKSFLGKPYDYVFLPDNDKRCV